MLVPEISSDRRALIIMLADRNLTSAHSMEATVVASSTPAGKGKLQSFFRRSPSNPTPKKHTIKQFIGHVNAAADYRRKLSKRFPVFMRKMHHERHAETPCHRQGGQWLCMRTAQAGHSANAAVLIRAVHRACEFGIRVVHLASRFLVVFESVGLCRSAVKVQAAWWTYHTTVT